MYKRYLYIIFVCIVLAGCRKESVPPVAPDKESIPPVVPDNDTTLIVFVSNRETRQYQFQVFTMNIDGSNVRRLTHDSNNYIIAVRLF